MRWARTSVERGMRLNMRACFSRRARRRARRPNRPRPSAGRRLTEAERQAEEKEKRRLAAEEEAAAEERRLQQEEDDEYFVFLVSPRGALSPRPVFWPSYTRSPERRLDLRDGELGLLHGIVDVQPPLAREVELAYERVARLQLVAPAETHRAAAPAVGTA